MIRRALSGLILAALLLAACGEQDSPPTGDPPILSGFESMPKQLATVALTPTPTQVVAGEPAEVVIVQASPTPGAPRPTATLTPYVGVFLGEPTSESGEPPPTLAPWVIDSGGAPVVSGGGIAPAAGGACTIPVMTMFTRAYTASLQQQLGCPVSGGFSTQMVTQPFERGDLYWRDTRQIFALADSGQFWQVADSWQDGMPADDPAFAPPGGLLQPVRGFGLVWRTNAAIRDALGWGTLPEVPYSAVWQDFERGAMFVGAGGMVYAIFPAEGRHSGPLSS